MVEFGFHSRFGSTMPARPTPNFFSAPRRVTDWARLLVSSSNGLFILFYSLWLLVLLFFRGRESRGRPGSPPSPTVTGIVGTTDSKTAIWFASWAAEGVTTSVAIAVCVREAS